jgi:uncharacterized integral membrane protein
LYGDKVRAVNRDSKQVVAGGVAAALTVAFAVANGQRVKVDWLITSTSSRLIFVIVAAALIGAIFGYVIAKRRG